MKPLVTELRARITEELDYELEAAAQKAFAKAYADDDGNAVFGKGSVRHGAPGCTFAFFFYCLPPPSLRAV